MLPFLALAALAADPEPKATVSVSATDDFELRYRIESARLPAFPDRPIFNYVEQVNRLTLQITRRQAPNTLSFWLQLDEASLFANRYILDGELTWERQLTAPGTFAPTPGDSYLNPEKLSLSWKNKRVEFTAGDGYVSLGRGIAVDLNRNVDIDIDTSVRGAKIDARPGDWDVIAAIGVLNRQQVYQDQPNLEIAPDRMHGLAAVRVVRHGLGLSTVGAHGVAVDYVQSDGWKGLADLGSIDAIVGGADLTTTAAGMDFYVEGDGMAYPGGRLANDGSDQPGYAVYGSAGGYGKITWLLEGKRYYRAEQLNTGVGAESYRLSIPPTLEYERVITEDSSAAVGSQNVYGGRLRADLTAFAKPITPYVSLGVFRDLDTGTLHFNHVPETIVHPVAGVEALGDELTLLANAGYRIDDRDGAERGTDQQAHADVDFKFPVGPLECDATAAIEYFQWGVNDFQQSDYVELESSFTVQAGSDWSFTWFTDVSSNPLVTTTGNLSDKVYGAGELQYKPADQWTIKAFYGSYKAGIRCSGGQCRLLPGFEGARIAVTGAI